MYSTSAEPRSPSLSPEKPGSATVQACVIVRMAARISADTRWSGGGEGSPDHQVSSWLVVELGRRA